MARPRPRVRETFPCPACGEEVPVGAPGCRACGSTDETGWSPDTEYDGLDLPDREEDDAEVERPSRRPLWVTVLVLLAVAATLLVSMW